MGVVFPAMRNGTEDFGLGAGADDSFFLESAEEPACSFCKDSRSSGKRRSIPGFGGMVSSFLTFVMLTLMSRVPRSSPTIAPSMEMTFLFYSSLASIETDLGFVFLPVKYLVLHLKRLRTHSGILSKVLSDVFELTCFLECLLRQLLDLDGCQLFLIPVNRQLSWCCDIELDEICWSSSECELQWCYTPVVTV